MTIASINGYATCSNTDKFGNKTLQTAFDRHETKPLTWVTGFYNTEIGNFISSKHWKTDYDLALQYHKDKFPTATFEQFDYMPAIARIAITFESEADEAEFIMRESL